MWKRAESCAYANQRAQPCCGGAVGRASAVKSNDVEDLDNTLAGTITAENISQLFEYSLKSFKYRQLAKSLSHRTSSMGPRLAC